MKKLFYCLTIIVATMMFSLVSCNEAEETMQPQPQESDEIKVMYNYLINQTGGKTSDDPVKLEVEIQLTELNWLSLLSEIYRARKYVVLDLTKCDYADVDKTGGFDRTRRFDPISDVKVGKNRIVEIILPSAAIEINGVFNNFENLKKVSAANVTTISSYSTFTSCTNLCEANFPKATNIGSATFASLTSLEHATISASATTNIGYSFQGCTLVLFSLSGQGSLSVTENGKALVRNNTELVAYPGASGKVTMEEITSISQYAFARSFITEANFPNVTSVEVNVFYNCTLLKKASLPNTKSVGNYCFYYCSNLEETDLSNASSIGYNNFYSTGNNALTIYLNSTPPEVGYGTFNYSGTATNPKLITVKVPSLINYDEAWQETFKGKGSTGTGTVNPNIVLTIVEYTP